MKISIRLVVLSAVLVLVAILAPLPFLSGAFAARPAPSVPAQESPAALPSTVKGVVKGPDGPLADVTVQVRGTTNTTKTAKNGSFTLRGVRWDEPVIIVTYKPFYMNGWVSLDPNAKDWKGLPSLVEITMKTLPAKDNYEYPWFSFDGVSGSDSCGMCHREYPEWQKDAHSQAATNPRFLTIYQGTNVQGQVGQSTSYVTGVAMPPDPSKPYYGPGYKLDEPMRNGNCAACHTPLAAKISNEKNCGWSGCHTNLTSERATRNTMDPGVSPLHLSGDAAEGISCDFCHKIGDVILDAKTRLPLADMPGILSLKLYRPQEGDQVFFGSYGDVARRVSYSPLMSQSEYCAACHYGVFGGVVGSGQVTGGVLIYNSYGEWLDSPYSSPKTGKTCQQCHMQTVDSKVSVFPEKGGSQRDYVDLHGHYMPGAANEQLLQNSVTMKSTASHTGDKLQVDVRITNDQTGHHIPTDAPIRQMILVVEALDSAGKPLALSQGPVLPNYAGNYSGQPGKSFAKILKDEWTGETPTAAYWRPVTIVEDTRLPAMATDTTKYTFSLPSGQAAQVKVQLVFRRAFQELAKQKGWTDPDILMEEATIQVKK